MYISSIVIELPVAVMNAHKTYCPPDWRWDNPGGAGRQNVFNLWLVVAGRGTIEASGESFAVGAGDCLLLRMWEPCRGRHDPDQPLTVVWLTFLVSPTMGQQLLKLPLRSSVVHLLFFSAVCERGVRAYLAGEEGKQDARIWLASALVALFEENRALPSRQVVEQWEVIEEACEWMRANPGRLKSVGELAASYHYTPGHFSRLFRRYIGLSPRAFLTQARIEAAKSLLLMSSQTIGEIATALGYFDVAHFSRQFKEMTGHAPSEFRARKPLRDAGQTR